MLKDLAPYDQRGLNTERSKDLGTFNTDVASAYTDHSLWQFVHFEKAIACHAKIRAWETLRYRIATTCD